MLSVSSQTQDGIFSGALDDSVIELSGGSGIVGSVERLLAVDPVLQQLFHGFGVCCVFAFDDSDFTCSRTGAGVGDRGSDVIRLVKVYGRRIDAHLAELVTCHSREQLICELCSINGDILALSASTGSQGQGNQCGAEHSGKSFRAFSWVNSTVFEYYLLVAILSTGEACPASYNYPLFHCVYHRDHMLFIVDLSGSGI